MTFLSQRFMITPLSIALEDLLGSSIALQVVVKDASVFIAYIEIFIKNYKISRIILFTNLTIR